MPKYARVLVDDSAGKAFDYELPEAVAGTLKPGSRVRVPVRTRTPCEPQRTRLCAPANSDLAPYFCAAL